MKLISCDACGIVIDLNYIKLPCEKDLFHSDGSPIEENIVWHNGYRYPKMQCPHCANELTERFFAFEEHEKSTFKERWQYLVCDIYDTLAKYEEDE